MKTRAEYVAAVLAALDHPMNRKMTIAEYVEALEEIRDDIDARIEAGREGVTKAERKDLGV